MAYRSCLIVAPTARADDLSSTQYVFDGSEVDMDRFGYSDLRTLFQSALDASAEATEKSCHPLVYSEDGAPWVIAVPESLIAKLTQMDEAQVYFLAYQCTEFHDCGRLEASADLASAALRIARAARIGRGANDALLLRVDPSAA